MEVLENQPLSKDDISENKMKINICSNTLRVLCSLTIWLDRSTRDSIVIIKFTICFRYFQICQHNFDFSVFDRETESNVPYDKSKHISLTNCFENDTYVI